MEKQELNGLVITETWLNDNKENDKIWMDCSLFNSGNDYKISVVNIPGIKKGGGLALIYRIAQKYQLKMVLVMVKGHLNM